MKWLHLSDLHLGKKMYEFSLMEDQKYILKQILEIIDEKDVGGVLIAGDIYDKSVPTAEAVQLFDRFLTDLATRELPVFIISGNHDSGQRLSFGADLMKRSGVHFSPVFSGKIRAKTVEDEYGTVKVWMMPFLRPSDVRSSFPEKEISGYNDAVKAVVEAMEIDPSERNLLVAHQFVTGALRSDSEDVIVGGLENIDASVFTPFDYVALGHVHICQDIKGICGGYCGTPLKYSFSEVKQVKSVTLVDMKQKGELEISRIPLVPLHDVKEIRGSYDELASRTFYHDMKTDDYFHVTLTDEGDVYDAVGRLRSIYPNIMLLDYDNLRTRSAFEISQYPTMEKKSELDLFDEFFEIQNGRKMEQEERTLITGFLEEIREGRQ